MAFFGEDARDLSVENHLMPYEDLEAICLLVGLIEIAFNLQTFGEGMKASLVHGGARTVLVCRPVNLHDISRMCLRTVLCLTKDWDPIE